MGLTFGTVTGLPQPLSLNTANPVYVGQVLLGQGKISRAYIKKVSTKRIAIEYAIAELTKQCGLSSPSPIVANWNGEIVFANIDAKTPSLFSLSENGDFQAIFKFLNNSSLVSKVASFDEVISNPDRNKQNILIKGDGDVILIDHERAFSSTRDKPTSTNQFLNLLTNSIQPGDDLNRHRVLKDIEEQITNFKQISVATVANLLVSANILSSKDRDLMIDYIEFRISNIRQLLRMQIGLESQSGLNFSA